MFDGHDAEKSFIKDVDDAIQAAKSAEKVAAARKKRTNDAIKASEKKLNDAVETEREALYEAGVEDPDVGALLLKCAKKCVDRGTDLASRKRKRSDT